MSPTGYIIIVAICLSIGGLATWRHQEAVAKCHATTAELKVLQDKVAADTQKALDDAARQAQAVTEAQSRSKRRVVAIKAKGSQTTPESLTAYFAGVGL